MRSSSTRRRSARKKPGGCRLPTASESCMRSFASAKAIVFVNDDFPEHWWRQVVVAGSALEGNAGHAPPVRRRLRRRGQMGRRRRASTVRMPAAAMFWGDRYGIVVDPFGHQWSFATHRKDMTPAEMQASMLRRVQAGINDELDGANPVVARSSLRFARKSTRGSVNGRCEGLANFSFALAAFRLQKARGEKLIRARHARARQRSLRS